MDTQWSAEPAMHWQARLAQMQHQLHRHYQQSLKLIQDRAAKSALMESYCVHLDRQQKVIQDMPHLEQQRTMRTQSVYNRLLHLRWHHYYQWMALLSEERKARRQLAKQHQEQLHQIRVAEKWTKVGPLLYDQLGSLKLLRQAQQKKRLELKAAQAQQMHLIQQQLVQLGKVNRFVSFEYLSALRRP